MGQAMSKVLSEAKDNPQGFWAQAAKDVVWIEPPKTILEDSNPPFYHWFTGGKINGCYNAVDRHVSEGRGDQAAIIYDSPVTDTKRIITYNELP